MTKNLQFLIIVCAIFVAAGVFFSVRASSTKVTPATMTWMDKGKPVRTEVVRDLSDTELNEFLKDRKSGFLRAFAARRQPAPE